MATTIEAVAVAPGRRTIRPGGARTATIAARRAVARARMAPGDLDLLISTGLYHDRILGEPAMAALIQRGVGANPEDPHGGGHGTFSFDVANGACGPLTALQIADGLLRSGTIKRALIVADDADPRHGLAPRFPYASGGAAMVCGWSAGETGLAGFRWANSPEHERLLRARLGFEGGGNVLRIERRPGFGARAAEAAGRAAAALLSDLCVEPRDVDLVVACPADEEFTTALPGALGVAAGRLVAAPEAVRVHTAALPVSLAAADRQGRLDGAHRVLLVAAGAGLVAGAALLRR
ncbi:MAG TPA: 3-oxoacyl-[acyl-carrier-protein] synthase III C-terminal domain-containing protein [Spirillospora sp.]|nr:3-oxoacyl-[acyl-carrier-protein] synthase III C-terminal domain-containing protein [Spirillospora sp.]